MKEVFVYDWYIELKLHHDWIRNALRGIEGDLEVLRSTSMECCQIVDLAKKEVHDVVLRAIELPASFCDRYYPVDRSRGETLQAVVQATWGTRREVYLSYFVQPISMRCTALKAALDKLKDNLSEIVSLDDIPSNIHISTCQTIEYLVNFCDALIILQQDVEKIAQEGEKGVLIWESQRYPQPGYLSVS